MKKKRYLITLVGSILILLLVLIGMNLWESSTQIEVIRILSNGFTVIGGVMFCFGLIIWVDNADGFRGFKVITYGVKKFFHYAIPFLVNNNIEKTFFDYYNNRKKEKAPVAHVLVIGSGYLLCAGILAVVFEYL